MGMPDELMWNKRECKIIWEIKQKWYDGWIMDVQWFGWYD